MNRGISDLLVTIILVSLALIISTAIVSLVASNVARVQQEQVPPIVIELQSNVKASLIGIHRDQSEVVVDMVINSISRANNYSVCILPIAETNTSFIPVLVSALEYSYIDQATEIPSQPLTVDTIPADKVGMPHPQGGHMTMKQVFHVDNIKIVCLSVGYKPTWLELHLSSPESLGLDSYTLRIYLATRYVSDRFEIYVFGLVSTKA